MFQSPFLVIRQFLLLTRNSDAVHCLQNKYNSSVDPSNARTTSPRELGDAEYQNNKILVI